MPVDLDGRESHELPRMVALWDAINEVVAASGGSTTNVSVARQKAVVRVHDALRPLAEELLTLRARVAELGREAEEARTKALDEAIEWCRLTEAGDTNEDWQAAARCVRELVEKAKGERDRMTTKDEPKPVEAERIAHVMITPWSLSNGIVMWCGLRADDCGEEHFVATSPEAITCERCKANMRDALETLSAWVERLVRER